MYVICYSDLIWILFFSIIGLVGTTFMFQFAMYVSTVREIVRPGVMWFVRDPNDPHFQPMQEILDRGFLLQLRKLTAGVIMYTIMILGGIGGFVVSLGVMETWLRLFSFESLEWYTFESSDLKNVTIPGFSFGSPHGPLRILPLKWEFK